MSAQDLETVCELVADLYKVYGVLPIVGHKDVSATSCPGRYYAKLAYIKKRAQEIMNGSKPSKPQPPKKKSISEIAKEVIAGKWGNGQDRVNRLKKAGYDPNKVQAEVNRQLGASTQRKAMNRLPVKLSKANGAMVRTEKNVLKKRDIITTLFNH